MAAAWFNPFLGEPGVARVWSALAGGALGSGLLWSVGAIYGDIGALSIGHHDQFVEMLPSLAHGDPMSSGLVALVS